MSVGLKTRATKLLCCPGALALAASMSLAASLPAQEIPREPVTRSFVVAFERADHWALRCIALSSLGELWHPVGTPIVLEALESKDDELRAFGLEVLRGSLPELLPHVASHDLVERLIKKELGEKNELYAGRVLDLLARIFPQAGELDAKGWKRFWSKERKSYAPLPWPPAGWTLADEAHETLAGTMVERAFDLSQDGLEVMICIDSTGSMQETIDAARDGLADIIALLAGIAPDLKLGLVHYKDLGEPVPAAEVIRKLSQKVESVEKALGRLVAEGGGDIPERVEMGLALALDPDRGWTPKANKIVLLIGDAPAHAEALPEAIDLVRAAFEKPFGQSPREAPEKGSRRTSTGANRPFVTSAIAVGRGGIPAEVADTMTRIATAGGGAYGTLALGGDARASTTIVRHLLIQAFGTRYKEQAGRFVEIYLEYHRAGFFD
ncbi:MAG: VWA domain-containing protein [Planctomycetota bacterium]|jgi:hypothetical protein|nr:VWA domain-containing protein [Planctomycetota bacterium]